MMRQEERQPKVVKALMTECKVETRPSYEELLKERKRKLEETK